MKPARSIEPPVDAISFLVVAGDRACRWGVDITHVETVIEGATAFRVVDVERLGVPTDAGDDVPVRVVQLRADGQRAGVAVRGRLTVATVRRTDVHALPALVVATMRHGAFSGVALADDDIAFLILDVEAALQEAA